MQDLKNIAKPTASKNQIEHCKVCGEPKQIFVEGFNILVPRSCACERPELERKAREEEIQKIENARVDAIPIKKFRTYTFANDDKKDIKTTNILKRYVSKFEEIRAKGLGLLFFGPTRTGKTYFAYCLANALIDKGYKVKATNLIEVLEYAENFNSYGRSCINEILNHDVILIDDLGAERDSRFAFEKIYYFVDRAFARDKVVILTTNLLLSELEKVTEDSADLSRARIYSRILEYCFPIKVDKVRRLDILKNENREFMLNLLKG